MFKNYSEVRHGSYVKGSNDKVQLAACSSSTKCLGKGTLSLQNVNLSNSIHVEGLNDTLVSVGHVCDDNKILIFTKKEAVVLDKSTIELKKTGHCLNRP